MLHQVLDLLTPDLCENCHSHLVKGEHILCTNCLLTIPRTNLHKAVHNPYLDKITPITAPVRTVAAFTYYKHDLLAGELIRRGKYSDRPDIIRYLADAYASDLVADNALQDVDALIAVPMHWFKRLRRGYNQADIIARQISKHTGIPVIKPVKVGSARTAQAGKSGAERLTNVKGKFRLTHPDRITGKHLAIIDDIITTGSTISELVATIHPAHPRALTILSLALTL